MSHICSLMWFLGLHRHWYMNLDQWIPKCALWCLRVPRYTQGQADVPSNLYLLSWVREPYEWTLCNFVRNVILVRLQHPGDSKWWCPRQGGHRDCCKFGNLRQISQCASSWAWGFSVMLWKKKSFKGSTRSLLLMTSWMRILISGI